MWNIRRDPGVSGPKGVRSEDRGHARYAVTERRRNSTNGARQVRALKGVDARGVYRRLRCSGVAAFWPVRITGSSSSGARQHREHALRDAGVLRARLPYEGAARQRQDTAETQFVAVVRSTWSSGMPAGSHRPPRSTSRPRMGIVGVVGTSVCAAERDREPQVYRPYQQVADEG